MALLRRARAHPGAQLSFTDHDGHRFQAILTDQPDPDIALLECRHRARARVEDHIRNDKQTGLQNLPFRDLGHNRVWLKLVALACDLLVWTQGLLLNGELAKAEPKRLRYRLLHSAARLAIGGRQARLRLQVTWPWATGSPPHSRAYEHYPRPANTGRQPAGRPNSSRRPAPREASPKTRHTQHQQPQNFGIRRRHERPTPPSLTTITRHQQLLHDPG